AFARHGAKVAISYSQDDGDAAEAERLIAAAGDKPLLLKGSVADPEHARAAVGAVAAAWGGIDVLVNNAGITQVLPISLLEPEDWDLTMDVNCKGAYLMSRAALRLMIRSKSGAI